MISKKTEAQLAAAWPDIMPHFLNNIHSYTLLQKVVSQVTKNRIDADRAKGLNEG